MRETRINYTEIFVTYINNKKIKIIIPIFDNDGFIYDISYDVNYCLEVANDYKFELVDSSYNDKYVVLGFKKIKASDNQPKENPIKKKTVD